MVKINLHPKKIPSIFLDRLKFCRGPKLNTNFFFLKLFGHSRDIPAKSRDIPPKKVWFPWLRGTYRTLWPPPLHVEDPHPARKYPDSKVWVWVPFSRLSLVRMVCIWGPVPITSKLISAMDPLPEDSLSKAWPWGRETQIPAHSNLGQVALAIPISRPQIFE